MHEDRDLLVIGLGAAAAVLTLLLPLPFGARALAAFFVMGAALILAFLRLGPDRLPAEVLLARRLRFRWTPRRRVYMRGPAEARPFPAPKEPAERPAAAPAPRPARPALPRPALSVSFSVEADEAAWAVRAALGVAGAYFAWWLAVEGGARSIALFLKTLLGG